MGGYGSGEVRMGRADQGENDAGPRAEVQPGEKEETRSGETVVFGSGLRGAAAHLREAVT